MFINPQETTINGYPIGMDVFFAPPGAASGISIDTSKTTYACLKGEAVRDQTGIQAYWTIQFDYTAAGVLVHQHAAIKTDTPPTWLSGLV